MPLLDPSMLMHHHHQSLPTSFNPTGEFTLADGREVQLDMSSEQACVDSCKNADIFKAESAEAEGEKASGFGAMMQKAQSAMVDLDLEQTNCMAQCRRDFELTCFPASATVQVRGCGLRRVDELEIGDVVQTGKDEASPVIGFLHRLPETISSFVELGVATGETLRLTSAHVLFVQRSAEVALFGNGARAASICAKHVTVGDLVQVASGEWATVASVTKDVTDVGLVAPLTRDGYIVVDGVRCSCYSVPFAVQMCALTQSVSCLHTACHLVCAPLRAAYDCGVAPSDKNAHELHPYGQAALSAYTTLLS